jgi:hypothetical protein
VHHFDSARAGMSGHRHAAFGYDERTGSPSVSWLEPASFLWPMLLMPGSSKIEAR